MRIVALFLIAMCGAGCEVTPSKESVAAAMEEAKRIAPREYTVAVESQPAGAVIEVNGDYRGKAPCLVTVPGTYYGRVLWQGLTIKAIPVRPGDFVQTKSFVLNDQLPKRIYFNMALAPVPPTINVNVQQ